MRLLDPKSSPLIRHEAQLQPHPAPDKELNSRQVSKAQRTRWRSAHRGTDKGARPHRAPPACAACPTGPGPLPNNTLQLATTCAPGAAAGTPGLLGDLLQRRMRERGSSTCPFLQGVSASPPTTPEVPLCSLEPTTRTDLTGTQNLRASLRSPTVSALRAARTRVAEEFPRACHPGTSLLHALLSRNPAGDARGAQVPAPSPSAAGALGTSGQAPSGGRGGGGAGRRGAVWAGHGQALLIQPGGADLPELGAGLVLTV